jgi:hypothetical protein
VSGLRVKNELNDFRRVNPLTLVIPHLDLDIGSYCGFQIILQTLDTLKTVAWKIRNNSSPNPNSHNKSSDLMDSNSHIK